MATSKATSSENLRGLYFYHYHNSEYGNKISEGNKELLHKATFLAGRGGSYEKRRNELTKLVNNYIAEKTAPGADNPFTENDRQYLIELVNISNKGLEQRAKKAKTTDFSGTARTGVEFQESIAYSNPTLERLIHRPNSINTRDTDMGVRIANLEAPQSSIANASAFEPTASRTTAAPSTQFARRKTLLASTRNYILGTLAGVVVLGALAVGNYFLGKHITYKDVAKPALDENALMNRRISKLISQKKALAGERDAVVKEFKIASDKAAVLQIEKDALVKTSNTYSNALSRSQIEKDALVGARDELAKTSNSYSNAVWDLERKNNLLTAVQGNLADSVASYSNAVWDLERKNTTLTAQICAASKEISDNMQERLAREQREEAIRWANRQREEDAMIAHKLACDPLISYTLSHFFNGNPVVGIIDPKTGQRVQTQMPFLAPHTIKSSADLITSLSRIGSAYNAPANPEAWNDFARGAGLSQRDASKFEAGMSNPSLLDKAIDLLKFAEKNNGKVFYQTDQTEGGIGFILSQKDAQDLRYPLTGGKRQ